MKKLVAVFDLHYPHQDKVLWDNIMKFIEEFQPDVFAFGGDNMNMDAVDHWKMEKGQKRPLEGRRLLKEYQGFMNDIQTPLVNILPKDCRKIWHFGNHCDWVEKYIDKHPEVEGMLEIRNNLDFTNWETYDYGKTSKVGKLYIDHGRYINQYSAAKTVNVYGRNIIYGHGHTSQSYTRVAPIDTQAHEATQVPCACKMNPDYMRNMPNAWVSGFAVAYMQNNGLFNLYVVKAINGHFVAPNGKYY